MVMDFPTGDVIFFYAEQRVRLTSVSLHSNWKLNRED